MSGPKPFRFGAMASRAQSRQEWVALARKVEDLGYSTLVMGEHPSLGFLSPIPALMAAVDATTTLRVASHVFTNDLRHPALLAHEAATLDLLSDGRLEFGLGGGWLGRDYATFGVPFDPPPVRIQRLEEAVSLIKRLFQNGPVTFDGDFYHVQGLDLQPKPCQRPHPPLLIGGGGRRVLSLAGREADSVGLDPKGTPTGGKDLGTTVAEVVEQQIGWIREAAGPRFEDLEIQVLASTLIVTDDRRRAAEETAASMAQWTMMTHAPDAQRMLDSPHFLIGTIEQIIEDLRAYRERYGISYITVMPNYVDAFSPIVARLAGQ